MWIPLAFLVDGVTMLMLPVRLADAERSTTVIGLVSALGLAVALVVQPLAGHLSDRLRTRVDRRAFMAPAALAAIAGLWLLAGPTAVPIAALGYILLQAGASAIQAAVQALIPDRITGAGRGEAAGWKTTFDVGGATLAFIVLGLLLADGNVTAAAAVATTLLLGGLVLVWALLPPSSAAVASAVVDRRPAGGGLARLVAARFLFLLGAFGVSRFLLMLVAERLEIDASRAADEAGLLLAAFALLTVMAAVPFGRLADRRGRTAAMVAGVVLSAVGIGALVPNAGVVGVVVGGSVMSVGTAAFITANWAALTDLAPGPSAGRLMGLANLGTGGAAAAAGALGPLIDALGFGGALAIAAVATGSALLPLLLARASGVAAKAGPVRTAG